MTSMYLLDANVFIQAKNFYYRFDTFPGFWNWLDAEQVKGQVGSIQLVYDELVKGNDELAAWIKERKASGWFLPVDDIETQQNFRQIANWIVGRQYTQAAQAAFLGGADPWLIAKAMTLGGTVVTQETFDEKSKKRVKIPNVCREVNVPYINTFDLLRRTGARFTLPDVRP